MISPAEHQEFASDNTAPICPEAFAALGQANAESVSSYGEDKWTGRLRAQVREIFETDCEVFLTFTGTAANALALAQLCQSFHSVICHEQAHISTDECGAPEFFTKGSKLLTVRGANGKIDMEEARAMIGRQPELHAPRPCALSISQTTELGTVYRPEEMAAMAEFARAHKLFLQIDGARFANAVAALNCAPREISWEAGADVLCFGGTKNGAGAGELVIFFKKELALEFDYRLKQAGQLASKMRFLAAPWTALLADGVWLRNAARANEGARKLAERLRSMEAIEVVFPVEANAVFLRLPPERADDLRARGWHFHKFIEPDVYRLMCSWSVKDDDINELVAALRAR